MSSIIVADIIGKEVVFSTTCSESSLADQSHAYLEIVRTVEPSPPGIPVDVDVMDCVEGVTQIITGSLMVGMVFTPPPANVVCGVLAAFGGLVSLGLGIFHHKEDPVAKKMEELKLKIQNLDKQIMARFDDMNSFITENKFSVEITGEVATLKKFMNDVIELHDEESIENFRIAYEQNPPLNIAYMLMSLLLQKSTNPLSNIIGSELDRLDPEFWVDRRLRLEKWDDIISTVIGDLLFIEGIAAGLLKHKDMYDSCRLIDQSNEIKKMLDNLNEIIRDQNWRRLKDYLPFNLKKTIGDNIETVAFQMKKNIEFYQQFECHFGVSDRADFEQTFYYWCAQPENFVETRTKEGRFAFIYRSLRAKKMNMENFRITETDVLALDKLNLPSAIPMKELMEKHIMAPKRFYGCGFIALFDSSAQPVFQYGNSSERDLGPENIHIVSPWEGGRVHVVIGIL